MQLADIIRHQRKPWLAEKLGFHKTTLYKKLAGDSEWTQSEMRALADLFNVSMNDVDQALTEIRGAAQNI